MLKEEAEPLPATVRRERMLQVIAEREFVRVADLSEAFGISDVTVRADLAALELTHAVRRVRGGAMAPSRSGRGERAPHSLVDFAGEKQRIGAYAGSLVRPGMSVLLDAGSTTAAVARALVARSDLEQVTVITNGLRIAQELAEAVGRFTVVVTGGTLRPPEHALVDPLATLLLEQLHADLAFIGCNGVDAAHGVTDLDLPQAEVKRSMIAAADRVVVVADGSKLGQVHLGRVATVQDVDTVVTGASAPTHELARLQGSGVDVVHVE